MIRKDEAYLLCEKNSSGSRPKELFEDVLEEIEDVFKKDRAALQDHIKEKDVAVTTTTVLEDFIEAMDEDSKIKDMPIASKLVPSPSP